eukprot:767876-Hanusia_phi.AAC.12
MQQNEREHEKLAEQEEQEDQEEQGREKTLTNSADMVAEKVILPLHPFSESAPCRPPARPDLLPDHRPQLIVAGDVDRVQTGEPHQRDRLRATSWT